MGCIWAKYADKDKEVDADVKKVYSWDLRKDENFDGKNYVIESLVNEEKIELPGSVDGNQFIIQNCKDSCIYVLDHMNTVAIYDCTNCKIILGPIKGSLNMGGCMNCIVVGACGQLRVRDSRKILAFVHCETQPCIEAATAISFGSYNLGYNELEEQLKLANVDVKRKNWKVVHDFTPLQSETNWKFIENDNAYDYVKDPVSSDVLEKLETCKLTWSNIDGVPQRSASIISDTMSEYQK